MYIAYDRQASWARRKKFVLLSVTVQDPGDRYEEEDDDVERVHARDVSLQPIRN